MSQLNRTHGSLESACIKFSMDSQKASRILANNIWVKLINQPQTLLRTG